MNVLEVKNVSKQFATHLALNKVSITVPDGCIYGLLGPNGAGKTTLIRIITQITAADEGEVFFNGNKIHQSNIYEIGYLPEERGLYKKMEVGEQLLYFAQLKGMSRNDALEKLKVWVDKFEIKGWWKKKVEELSKGMQQKIQFIATVVHEPKLIILDEPFSGFDPVNANIITDEILRLKEKGCSIIFSTHRMESVEQLCDNIALINRSQKVLEGSVKQIRQDFKPNIFELNYIGQTLVLNDNFEILSTQHFDNNIKQSNIKIKNTVSPNSLISEAINQVEVLSFAEHLPSMQEIFIKLVSE
ncbi:MAG: ATP-binding cassette domain-containing protein [Bacteroidota bacterium]